MDGVVHVQQMLQEYGALPPALNSLPTHLVGTPQPRVRVQPVSAKEVGGGWGRGRQPLFRSEVRGSDATRVQGAWVVVGG